MTGVMRATGRERAEWFALLDKWGAAGRPYREIADWLTGKHNLSRWWAQKLIVEYEQERGFRPAGVRRDGTFEVTASKTVEVPVKKLFDAFNDEKLRGRWLGGYELEIHTVRPSKSLTARWEDGTTRITVSFESKDKKKSQVALAHERIADAQGADDLKAFWRERLDLLKKQLEV